jgi:hypothetical protein
MRRTLIWLAVAPLGIGLTTGLTITTTLLSQQPIGLASEPLSAGVALAPPVAEAAAGEPRAHAAKRARALVPRGGRALPTIRPAPTAARVTPPVTAPSPPVDAAPPPRTTKPVAPVKHPTRTKQPAPTTTPKHLNTRPDEQGGGGSQPSGDHGGSDNSGSDSSGHSTPDD